MSKYVVDWLASDENGGADYMKDASQIKEVWLMDFSGASHNPSALFDNLPTQIQILTLVSSFSELVKWLDSALARSEFWPTTRLFDLQLVIIQDAGSHRASLHTNSSLGRAVCDAHILNHGLVNAGMNISPSDWVSKLFDWIEADDIVPASWRTYVPAEVQAHYAEGRPEGRAPVLTTASLYHRGTRDLVESFRL